jgi:hypothetical protein
MTFGEYGAKLNIMCFNLAGADCIFFLKIVSSGLWSDFLLSVLYHKHTHGTFTSKQNSECLFLNLWIIEIAPW